MNRTFTAIAVLALATSWSQAPVAAQSTDEQIAAASLAAPEDRRAEATILGYVDGAVTTLRKGTNDLICLADDPSNTNFSVACYHESLEPFMARGRQLSAEGITGNDRKLKRFEEIESGKLAMPRDGRMLYVTSGDGYDAANNTVTNGSTRWVIYMPFATPEATGLTASPSRGAPWLMDSGTAGAHVMLMPPQ